jgi:hypothetical protein
MRVGKLSVFNLTGCGFGGTTLTVFFFADSTLMMIRKHKSKKKERTSREILVMAGECPANSERI